MAFPKAIQNTNSEEYQRFILAKFTHSAEAKMYYKARKLYKDSLDPLVQLKWYKAAERYSTACKIMTAEKERYERVKALEALRNKGIDISTLTLKNIAEISVATSMKDVMDQVKKENEQAVVMADPTAQEFAKYLQTPEAIRMKDKFLREMEEESNDPTLDNSPLPEESSNEL